MIVWNRTEGKARALSDETGCAVAATPRALAEGRDVLVTMSVDDASSEAVHRGSDGIFKADTAALKAIEMGTISPQNIDALMQSAPPDTIVIDAPVSGATQAARDSQLLIMAVCTRAAGAPLMPLFDTMGRQTVFLDDAEAGAVMKLAVNALIYGLNPAFAEAPTLAEAAGIAPCSAFDAIESSAAAAPMLACRRPLYLDEAGHVVTFTVALARKDIEVTVALAQQLGVAVPQGRETLARLQDAEAQGYGARDMPVTLDYLRKETR